MKPPGTDVVQAPVNAAGATLPLEPPLSAASPDSGGARRIVRNSAFNLASQVTHGVVNVICIFVLAQRMDKSVLGAYYTVFALMLAVQLIMEAGISTVLTSRLLRSAPAWGRIVEEAAGLLLLEMAGAMVLLVGVGAVWASWSGNSSIVLCCAAAGVAAAALQVERYCAGVFRAAGCA